MKINRDALIRFFIVLSMVHIFIPDILILASVVFHDETENLPRCF